MKTKKLLAVYVSTTNTIGVVIDEGGESWDKWYRTDSCGVRDGLELIPLYTKKEVRDCKKQLNASIAPSTSKIIGL